MKRIITTIAVVIAAAYASYGQNNAQDSIAAVKLSYKKQAMELYEESSTFARKNLVSGSLSTVFGAGFGGGGAYLLVKGVPMLKSNEVGSTNWYMALGFVAGGGIAELIALPLLITGPIKLVKGAKYSKVANQAGRDMELTFEPVFSPLLNPTTGAINCQTGAGMRLKF